MNNMRNPFHKNQSSVMGLLAQRVSIAEENKDQVSEELKEENKISDFHLAIESQNERKENTELSERESSESSNSEED